LRPSQSGSLFDRLLMGVEQLELDLNVFHVSCEYLTGMCSRSSSCTKSGVLESPVNHGLPMTLP
jgi:hypothetical protein